MIKTGNLICKKGTNKEKNNVEKKKIIIMQNH